MRYYRDSTRPGLIPLDFLHGVLAYINGRYAWTEAEIARFTRAHLDVARIDVTGTAWSQAAILDVERGDATPEVAAGWIPRRDEFRPGTQTIYVQRSNMAQLFDLTPGLAYWLLVADWTGAAHEVPGPLPKGVRMAGTQYATDPGIYDQSAIYADAWHK